MGEEHIGVLCASTGKGFVADLLPYTYVGENIIAECSKRSYSDGQGRRSSSGGILSGDGYMQ